MTRILENLIGNAFKYGLDPEPVTVKVDVKNIQVDISVHNEGKPISLQDQQSLFDQFRRAEDTKLGGKDGWGLGLTLVKGLAEAMGGYVSVQSSLAEGTTFMVCLPR
ncbi:MAG: HAMP domain-containing histidine kinase [Proteobacteria bacterium]|nr:MAG: HAMP domain-containing histidine kinase [Pseudomonadota bacterium]